MVQYNENDTPNKYGETKKMQAIWELIYTGKTLDDADFEPTKEDREYYDGKKMCYEAVKRIKGHDFRFEHFINDID